MYKSDFLVIGSGIAGLTYALEVAKYGSVNVVCKGEAIDSNTRYAQGGIASVTDPEDSFASHIEDTLSAGAGLCHKHIAKLVVERAPEVISKLEHMGAKFDRDTNADSYHLGQEGGHSSRRILHKKDTTGAEIQNALYENAKKNPNITIYVHHIAVDLISQTNHLGQREIIGAYFLDKSCGEVKTFGARTTMLATGGCGKVYLYTTNPDIATGDGIAMAYRAGASIANMEFIQFHPTCLFNREKRSFLLTEALRGEGAKLRLRNGREFMRYYDSRAELAPRDIVARAIDDQLKATGDDYVLLDITHRGSDFIKDHFPNIYQTLLDVGLDMTKEAIPVVPAAHYCCGGVQTDSFGRTNIRRLYAAGEVACTGLHGANRLASNSLLEAFVFAEQAAKDTISNFKSLGEPKKLPAWDSKQTTGSKEEVLVSHTWDEVRRTMWNLVGIVRSTKRLELAVRRFNLYSEEILDYYWKFSITSDLIELRNIIVVAELIVRSALSRKESRGLHYTSDYPNIDNINFLHDTIITRDGN